MIEAVENAAAVQMPKPPGRETITRDLECLLHTYIAPDADTASLDAIDCPLNSLGLIRQGAGQQLRFRIGSKPTLPAGVFFYAMMQFWRWRGTGRTLSVRDVTHGEGSPGRVFKLDEDSILDYLDDLAAMSNDVFRYDDAALTPQIVQTSTQLTAEDMAFEFLRRYYEHV